MRQKPALFKTLDKVREPDLTASVPASVLSTILVGVFGVAVGLLAQAAEFFAENSTVWWQDIVKDLQFDSPSGSCWDLRWQYAVRGPLRQLSTSWCSLRAPS